MNDTLEKARAAALKERATKIIVCAVVGFLGFISVVRQNLILGLAGFAISFLFCWTIYSVLSKNRAYAAFVSLYKKEMINTALGGGQIFEEMQFDYNCGVNSKAINDSGMISADQLFSDCFISGKYRGISFIQADVRNIRRDRQGNTLEYDGTYAIIPTKLPDATQTNIYDKKADISYTIRGRGYKTGNAEFDGAFKVYTTNADKAGQLLSSEVINRLLYIRQHMSGRMAATVKNGNMYIFMSRKNSPLKPGLFKKYNDEMRQSILKELSRVQLFIDAFSDAV